MKITMNDELIIVSTRVVVAYLIDKCEIYVRYL